jgi:hypothetical protein
MLLHAVRVLRSILRERRKARSPAWRRVRDDHIAEHPTCAACGGRVRVQVHHVRPYHLYPERELDRTNLVSLCMGRRECHLLVGHGGSWSCYVATVRELAGRIHEHPDLRMSLEGECRQLRADRRHETKRD